MHIYHTWFPLQRVCYLEAFWKISGLLSFVVEIRKVVNSGSCGEQVIDCTQSILVL